MIKLWRNEAILSPGKNTISIENIFPSGRQALSQAIASAGLGRSSRVAIPEWSSQCVINAVGRYATPVPINEVLWKKIKIDALLVYEQWGWPVSEKVMGQLEDYFRGVVFIQDMVDSAHFFAAKTGRFRKFRSFIKILSLSKLLGLSGGGIAVANDQYLGFKSDKQAEEIMWALESNNLIDMIPSGPINMIIKNDLAALDPNLRKWIGHNDLKAAINIELKARQTNLLRLLKNPLTRNWPAWMKEAAANGAGPGIAPLFRGVADNYLEAKQAHLLAEHGIETSLYHFNWSGDPLEPQYEKCLAFPMHGQVQNIGRIIEDIDD